MATINLGNLTFTHKGDYAGGTAYVKNDVVYYATNGNSYIAKGATTGNAPTSTAHWDLFVAGSSGIWNAGLSLGTAGQVVKVNSGANALEFGDAGGGLQSQQVFTSTGTATWTKPTGIKKVKVYVTGGGAGGTAIEIIDVSSVSSVTVTVGTAGSGASANSSNAGGNGATSSFGSYCSATGGTGGYHAAGGGASNGEGGIGTNGEINIKGGWGGQHAAHNTQDSGGGGTGGTSYYGGGGRPANGWAGVDAQLGQAFGSGGGGGHHSDKAGATGKAGIVVVEEYK
jgi:hypothetical protein